METDTKCCAGAKSSVSVGWIPQFSTHSMLLSSMPLNDSFCSLGSIPKDRYEGSRTAPAAHHDLHLQHHHRRGPQRVILQLDMSVGPTSHNVNAHSPFCEAKSACQQTRQNTSCVYHLRFHMLWSSRLNEGAKTKETIAINFMRMLREGPEVSLRGSPTVSPTTPAL